MKPALTVEEWKDWVKYGDETPAIEQYGNFSHAVAALSLHNQPFGFTREDVEMLRSTLPADTLILGKSEEQAKWELQELADRIESLLPPEE